MLLSVRAIRRLMGQVRAYAAQRLCIGYHWRLTLRAPQYYNEAGVMSRCAWSE